MFENWLDKTPFIRLLHLALPEMLYPALSEQGRSSPSPRPLLLFGLSISKMGDTVKHRAAFLIGNIVHFVAFFPPSREISRGFLCLHLF